MRCQLVRLVAAADALSGMVNIDLLLLLLRISEMPDRQCRMIKSVHSTALRPSDRPFRANQVQLPQIADTSLKSSQPS
jgi:hypothetical protein